MSDQVYHHRFTDLKSILFEFDLDPEALEGCEILFASYEIDPSTDDGEAFVLLYNSDGVLSEVYAAHHDHDGLEGLWYPEVTTKKEIQRLIDSDDIRVEGWHRELRRALEKL